MQLFKKLFLLSLACFNSRIFCNKEHVIHSFSSKGYPEFIANAMGTIYENSKQHNPDMDEKQLLKTLFLIAEETIRSTIASEYDTPKTKGFFHEEAALTEKNLQKVFATLAENSNFYVTPESLLQAKDFNGRDYSSAGFTRKDHQLSDRLKLQLNITIQYCLLVKKSI